MLAYWRPGAGIVVGILLLLFLPGRWWRWKTRRFHRGLRSLKGGDAAEARTEFERFLTEMERDARFERWQPIFNLGRRYSYPGATHANIGVTWLHEGEPERALHHFEIARRLDAGETVRDLRGMRGVCYLLGKKEAVPAGVELPSFETVKGAEVACALKREISESGFQVDIWSLTLRSSPSMANRNWSSTGGPSKILTV